MTSEQLRAIIQSADLSDIINVVIWKNGEEVATFARDEEIRRNLYSASKSFTSAAVGIAIKEGLISLSDRVIDEFPDQIPAKPDENLDKLAVKDLLTMSLGQEKGFLMGGSRLLLKEHDWVKYVLHQPLENTPGKKFVYNNAGPYLAGILVQKKAGCNLVDYLMPRLFEPLGILRPVWEVDPLGRTFGAGGLFLSTTDMVKFGQLYLQGGIWNGKQILPSEWVNDTAEKHAEVNEYGYGYLFWLGPNHSFSANGKYGQFIFILKEKNAVIAVNAESREDNRIQNCIFEKIYPKL